MVMSLPHEPFFQDVELLVTPVRRWTGDELVLGWLGAAEHIPGRAAADAGVRRAVQPGGGAAGATRSPAGGRRDHTAAAAYAGIIAGGLEGEHVVVVQRGGGDPLVKPHARIGCHHGRKQAGSSRSSRPYINKRGARSRNEPAQTETKQSKKKNITELERNERALPSVGSVRLGNRPHFPGPEDDPDRTTTGSRGGGGTQSPPYLHAQKTQAAHRTLTQIKTKSPKSTRGSQSPAALNDGRARVGAVRRSGRDTKR
jgi:hypothetical protein